MVTNSNIARIGILWCDYVSSIAVVDVICLGLGCYFPGSSSNSGTGISAIVGLRIANQPRGFLADVAADIQILAVDINFCPTTIVFIHVVALETDCRMEIAESTV